MKPTLKAPGAKRLKLEPDKLLSKFAFNLNLRRYKTASARVLLGEAAFALVAANRVVGFRV